MSARSAVILAPPADKLVHSLKYGGWSALAEEMAGFMVDSARHSGYALAGSTLVPVPTTPRRRMRRGYNQARLLAGALARRAGGTLIDAMERRDERESQVSLPPRERRANVHGAFSLAHGAARLRGMDLILVDDVLTTGATASAAAEVLEAGGAATVRLLTFARSIPEPW